LPSLFVLDDRQFQALYRLHTNINVYTINWNSIIIIIIIIIICISSSISFCSSNQQQFQDLAWIIGAWGRIALRPLIHPNYF